VKYSLAVEVKLVQIPEEPEPIEPPRESDNPMSFVANLANRVVPNMYANVNFAQPAGFEFRKQITVSAQDFPALAQIIGKFDNLVSEIEFGALTVKE